MSRQAFLDAHPELDERTRGAIRDAPWEVMTGEWGEERSVPYEPRDYLWSAAECWAAHPDLCRQCYEPRPYGTGQEHFGWSLWRVCRIGCPCAHHETEVWRG